MGSTGVRSVSPLPRSSTGTRSCPPTSPTTPTTCGSLFSTSLRNWSVTTTYTIVLLNKLLLLSPFSISSSLKTSEISNSLKTSESFDLIPRLFDGSSSLMLQNNEVYVKGVLVE